MVKKTKKINDPIIDLVEKAIKIYKTKLKLCRHLGVEWTTVDRWKEGIFKPSIVNYMKLLEVVKKGKADE